MYPILRFHEYRQAAEYPPCPLSKEEVHIWYLDSTLSYEPILRALLGAYGGVPAEKVCLKRSAHGKPYWQPPAGIPEVFFNVSHSGEWTLLAFCAFSSLGIDLQQIKPLARQEAIASRLFHPSEKQAYETLPKDGRTEVFYHLWTIKEACLKCIGTGLSAGADTFYVNLTDLKQEDKFAPVHTKQPSATDWAVCTLPCPQGYVASLAILPPDQISTIHPSGASIRPI